RVDPRELAVREELRAEVGGVRPRHDRLAEADDAPADERRCDRHVRPVGVWDAHRRPVEGLDDQVDGALDPLGVELLPAARDHHPLDLRRARIGVRPERAAAHRAGVATAGPLADLAVTPALRYVA